MPKNQKWLMPMIPNISAYKYYSFCRSEMSSFNNVNIKCAQSLVPQYMTVATLTKSDGVKVDGFVYPNFMYIPKMEAKSSSTIAPQ